MKNIEKHINASYEIDLLLVCKKLLKKSWLILVVALILGGVNAAKLKATQAPIYQSSFSMILEDSNEAKDSQKTASKVQEINTFKVLSSSFVELLKGEDIMTAAAEYCGNGCTIDTIRSKASIQANADTGIYTISVTCENKEEALLYANAIKAAVKNKLPEILKDSNAIVINNPKLPSASIGPNINNAFVKGAFVGFVLMFVILAIKCIFEDKVENAEQLEKRYKIVVLGELPRK